MIISEIILVHRMLKEKVSGLSYVHEWIKVLHPVSWSIFHMRNLDQAIWNRIKSKDATMRNQKLALEDHLKIQELQLENAKKLKSIIHKNGYITISKFGIIASHCAWLILQHDDKDNAFRKQYLDYMQQHKSEFHSENIKMLEKRINHFK